MSDPGMNRPAAGAGQSAAGRSTANAQATAPAAVSAASLDARTFAIGVLAVTAVVMFVGLLLIAQLPAQAIGMNDRGGDYVMVTQQVSNASEAVVVIDAAAKRMNTYMFNYNTRELELIRQDSLENLPKRPQPDVREQPRRGRR